jgi:hypothetical protein
MGLGTGILPQELYDPAPGSPGEDGGIEVRVSHIEDDAYSRVDDLGWVGLIILDVDLYPEPVGGGWRLV